MSVRIFYEFEEGELIFSCFIFVFLKYQVYLFEYISANTEAATEGAL